MLSSCFNLFFPRNCAACVQALNRNESVICFNCRYSLPRTGFHLQPGNPVEKLFWGRLPISAAAACFEFRQSGGVQHMLHLLKYKGAQEVGRELGRIYGSELLQSSEFARSECIVPVPLHPAKERMRGYNQSRVFGEGLSESMTSTALCDAIERVRKTDTQTKKSRFERWNNVETVFEVKLPDLIRGKRVLLIDDVITTGATLEACGARLLRAGAESVAVACIAATR